MLFANVLFSSALSGSGGSGGTLADIVLTISSNTTNYDLRTAAIAAGWDGVTAKTISCTVGSGVIVGASSTSTYAFTVSGSFPVGTVVNLINNGYIVGAGGKGGDAYAGSQGASSPGLSGGSAIYLNYNTTITNNGIVGGGGGGGGGGSFSSPTTAGGGGGGAGYTVGSGGLGSWNGGTNGAAGSLLVGGTGGSGTAAQQRGGDGGALGSSGAASGSNESPGGGSGKYITGNSYATWITTGDRRGGVA